jgi:hypothetical protein
MNKIGAEFDFEWPHLDPGAVYYFPGDKQQQERQNQYLIKNRKELTKKLLPEVKKEIKFFNPKTSEIYPYVQESQDGIIFHINFGECFKLGIDGPGDKMVYYEGINYFGGNAIAYNIASKLIEMINPDIDTPKILHDKNMTLHYPLPKDLKLLPKEKGDWKLEEEWIKGLYEIAELENPKTRLTSIYQKIENEDGNIFVRDGVLEATVKDNHQKISWVCSTLMGLTS